MRDSVQLDLFGDWRGVNRAPDARSRPSLRPEEMPDEGLIAAIPDATLADARALTAEAAKRRLSAAIPALVALCNRFAGYGRDAAAPEQAAALEALGAIGGAEASRGVVQLIAKKIVQGPALVVATAAASELGVVFPNNVGLSLLRDSNPSVRAQACACVRPGYEVVTALIAMLDEPDGETSAAAACALGRMGRAEARVPLKRHLTERPSRRVVEALAGVADEEAVVKLARLGRARPDLAPSILAALEEIDGAKAASAAAALRAFVSKTAKS